MIELYYEGSCPYEASTKDLTLTAFSSEGSLKKGCQIIFLHNLFLIETFLGELNL